MPPSRPAARSPASRSPRSSTPGRSARSSRPDSRARSTSGSRTTATYPSASPASRRSRCSRRSARSGGRSSSGACATCSHRAARVALQTITIEEARFEDYRRHPDFIQRYIFPGGMLPSPERFAEAARAQGLAVCDTALLRQQLRGDTVAVGRALRGGAARRVRAGLRRAVRTHVALLPVVLPRGLLGRHRRRDAGAARGVVAGLDEAAAGRAPGISAGQNGTRRAYCNSHPA